MLENILDTLDLPQLGQRLQQARKKQGLTQEAAAKIINVARTTLTAIENGERRVKASELMKLADAYNREISDFVRDKPEVGEFQVQFRSALSKTPEDEARIGESIDLLQELCQNYLELEQLTNKPFVQNYPPLYRYAGRPTEQAAEGLAMAERNRLGLGDAPIPVLREILEQNVGLRIFYFPIQPSSKFSEIYIYEPTLGGCIAINKLHTKGRCRLSLAHAYAHFLAHRSKPTVSLADQYQRKPESERFADSFAQYFLMPTNGITQRFNALYQAQGKVTPADLVKFAHYYGVAFEAILRRLEGMQLVPSGLWERLKARGFKVQEAQQQLGLESIPEWTEQFPKRYIELAVEAYDEGELSEGELAKYLKTDRLTARTMADNQRQQAQAIEAFDQDIMALVDA
ncbi:MAG: XRE family transcriptional regulator [Chloroflexi bacterium]|nr:XRE family transcriptional regulator [Chloroflexota bacterium]